MRVADDYFTSNNIFILDVMHDRKYELVAQTGL